MGVLSFIKRFLLFMTIWVVVFGAICYVFPFQYFNEKFSGTYNVEKTQHIGDSRELAVESSAEVADFKNIGY